ncbi:MAG: YqfO family protein [Patescibacteria group bacterium]|jgi:hypothetical protein
MQKVNQKIYKIQVFVPETHLDQVRIAIGESGAGKIGNYDYCSYVSKGEGYFRPLKGSKPFIGKLDEIEKVSEYKIEFVCKDDQIEKTISAIKSVHPYEEIAFDVFPLESKYF